MTESARVSVVMPVFNGEKFIRDAMKSVLCQTLTDLELLVIDDGSTDGSVEIVNAIQDSRIRLVRNEQNMGLPFTRNRGIGLAKGIYIAYLDCDDVAEPTRLEKQVAFLDANPDFGLVGSWAKVIDVEGNPIGEVLRLDYIPEEIPAVLLFHNCFVQSAVTMRRSAIPEGGYDKSFAYCEDYELWARMSESVRMYNYPEALNRYRQSINSTSSRHATDMVRYHLMVTRKLLAKLGIQATDDELDLHRCLGNGGEELKIVLLDEVERWLQRLLVANDAAHHYSKKALRRICGDLWLQTCWIKDGRITSRCLSSSLFRNLGLRKRVVITLRYCRSIFKLS